MAYQQLDPDKGRMAPVEPRHLDPSQRTTSRQALWSCAVAIAVVFVLGIVFYQINAADRPGTVKAVKAPATTSASINTNPAPQTTGRGGQR